MKLFALTILVFWLAAVVIGRIMGLQPNEMDLNSILASPNAQLWLGADDLGRDILARVFKRGRSLAVGECHCNLGHDDHWCAARLAGPVSWAEEPIRS